MQMTEVDTHPFWWVRVNHRPTGYRWVKVLRNGYFIADDDLCHGKFVRYGQDTVICDSHVIFKSRLIDGDKLTFPSTGKNMGVLRMAGLLQRPIEMGG